MRSLALLLSLLPTACAVAPSDSSAPTAQPVVDNVDQRIEQGRALLASGKAREAQAVFEAAAQADSQSLRTRQWVIRSWLPQGRVNDSLDAIDALAKDGSEGAAIDYLYGMAFAFKGREYIQQNVQGQIIDMSFADAVSYLTQATDAEPVLYQDAFAPLAEAAWFRQQLDVARAAAEHALGVEPDSAAAAMMLGRIALSQYVALKADPARKHEADEHWDAACKAFDTAAANSRASAGRQTEAAAALVELGHTYAWKEQFDEAARAYGEAIARDPGAVNFAQLLGTLRGERFLAVLEAATPEYARLHAPDAQDDASLLWWLGWARFDQKQYAEAERTLARAVAKNPAFLNSWYYMALARYQQQDYEGAFGALRRNWDENPSDLIASLGSDRDANLAILDFLVGWCAQAERSFEAGLLSEMQANTAPQTARFWNNMGLFYRDAGEPLKTSEREEDRQLARNYFETAYRAYSAALALSPEDPSILNDTAVMLHYYLDRELERAADLYKQATDRATSELARTDLPAELRTIYATALRDSKNNLAKLGGGKRE